MNEEDSSDEEVCKRLTQAIICLVTIAKRSHLFPCRTQKLSSLAPMVVGLTFRESRTLPGKYLILLFHSSSVVELSAVNRSVVGSSPTCGAMAPWSSG